MRKLAILALIASGVVAAASVNIDYNIVYQALFRPWSRTTAQLPAASAWTGYVAYDSTKSALAYSNGSAWVSNGFASVGPGIAKWDFPALGGGGVNCADSATLAMTGVAYGDGCVASTDLGMDGGSVALYLNATFSCYAKTNGVVFRACAWAADAGTPGALDLPDAGYFARVLH